MTKDIAIGLIIIFAGIFSLTFLLFWSKRTLKIIAEKKLTTIREILRELHHGRQG